MTALNPEDRKLERDRARRIRHGTVIDLITSLLTGEGRSERTWREDMAQGAQDAADMIDRDIQEMNRQHELWQQQFRRQIQQRSKHNGPKWV